MQVYDELVARGLIAQVTNEDEIREMVNNGKAVFYIGFDPTADSLHVGHFMALCLMKRLQMAGNKPIALIGGGTAMIGDPSGRTDMRQMMTKETIQHNCDCFKKQMSKFIDFSDGKAIMVNNADWLLPLNYIEMLRDVGAHFSVNRMLTAECYKKRMEKGLSFLEFNYMIMQSYDFYMLYQKYGCNMQFGGDDQWSNMLGGTELIRRKLGKDAHAMTITLLLNSEGNKMGKTAKGAVWLDPEKTSPYEFYQYWRNVSDADVLKCLRMLTFLPLEQIDEMDKWEGSQLNEAKKTELLFLTLFLRILKTGGRCACIVPDGVLFGSSTAHKSIRKEIVENQRLEAVISMPSGVFKPYAGVSTAILIFTKTEHGGTDQVWFYDMTADGFSLDDKRAPIADNDIPDIIERFRHRDEETDRKRTEKSFLVPKEEIVENDYDLSINKYKEIEYVAVEYPPTSEIMANIREIEAEIAKEMDELEKL